MAIHEEFACYSFRNACGFSAHPSEKTFRNWTETTNLNFSDLFPSFLPSETSTKGEDKEEIELLDLKVSSTWMGSKSDFNDFLAWNRGVRGALAKQGGTVIIYLDLVQIVNMRKVTVLLLATVLGCLEIPVTESSTRKRWTAYHPEG